MRSSVSHQDAAWLNFLYVSDVPAESHGDFYCKGTEEAETNVSLTPTQSGRLDPRLMRLKAFTERQHHGLIQGST